MLNIIYGDVKNSIYNTNVYFNKCSKNSPTSSGGEMNCTSEHICSKKVLIVQRKLLFSIP